MKKIVYSILGCVCVGVGAIGTIVPVLPTVPFLMLAACCYARSSENWNIGLSRPNFTRTIWQILQQVRV